MLLSKSDSTISICAYPRLHICLLDLSGKGYRRNGGVGFAVDAPSLKLKFSTSQYTDISVLTNFGFTEPEIVKLSSRLQKISTDLELGTGISIIDCGEIARHTGFGSGTAITLSCVEALLVANNHPIDKATLQQLSGRGGVSGIGINTYFDGGLVFDAGRVEDGQPFMPSGVIDTKFQLPVSLVSMLMPSWQIGILTSADVQPLSSQAECQVFESVCPLSPQDVHEAVYHATFGVVSSALSHDFSTFCVAINTLQQCIWKRSEIAAFGDVITKTMSKLRDLGCDAVGLTSLGPSLYFLAKDFDQVCSRIRIAFPDARLIQTQPRNQGREITVV